MTSLQEKISSANWAATADQLNGSGYAIIPAVLNVTACEQLSDQYTNPDLYRKTVSMERYRFGKGEYKYFRYPLPEIIQTIRESVYPYLAPVANGWMEVLKQDTRFPLSFTGIQASCHQRQQLLPTPLILRYAEGGFNTLHQDLYGEVFFPMQVVFVLNKPGIDFTGGEFVLTEQTPRAQSKAIVLTPQQGDMLIFTTQYRPVKGSKGYYRVNMKHGVSEVRSGKRNSLGVIFHDALS
jgi:uncharacterized protein